MCKNLIKVKLFHKLTIKMWEKLLNQLDQWLCRSRESEPSIIRPRELLTILATHFVSNIVPVNPELNPKAL